MRGVGKSTLLKTYAAKAITIEAEAIQAEAVKIAKGRAYPLPYSWKVWDENLIIQAEGLLREGLKSVYPDLQASNKPLLIVGAFLIKDWFRAAMLSVIGEMFPAHMQDVKLYVLHPDARSISNQIHQRGRPHEASFVNDLTKIQERRKAYWSLASAEREKVTSHNDLHAILATRI